MGRAQQASMASVPMLRHQTVHPKHDDDHAAACQRAWSRPYHRCHGHPGQPSFAAAGAIAAMEQDLRSQPLRAVHQQWCRAPPPKCSCTASGGLTRLAIFFRIQALQARRIAIERCNRHATCIASARGRAAETLRGCRSSASYFMGSILSILRYDRRPNGRLPLPPCLWVA